VVLIVVDTLRADRLGAYGNKRGLTPFLDSLAGRGTVFRRVVAPSSWTNPSVASLLTSRYQSQHGIVSFASKLAESEVTLPEVLHDRGYVTGAFTANALLRPTLGFRQGFDEYQLHWRYDAPATQKYHADQLNRDVLAWLDARPAEQRRQPAFLYIQYVEPHTPYDPPESALAKVCGNYLPNVDIINAELTVFGMVPETQLGELADVYDAEVRSLDEGVRGLFAGLESRRFLDHALVIITADHGDQMMEHGGLGHGRSLYEEEVRIPLIVFASGQRTNAESEELVSLLDVAPTVLAAAGVSAPRSFEGRSLGWALPDTGGGWTASARVDGAGRRAATPVFTQLLVADDVVTQYPDSHRAAVLLDHRKLVVRNNGREEFYDLAADPAERDPNALDEGARGTLRSVLQSSRAEATAVRSSSAPPVDPETAARMRALGYLR
jgi:arylsulfatase A-like enzyme